MDILSNIDNPKLLEKLYRGNKSGFRRQFNMIYPHLSDHKLADYWNERLNFEGSEISWGSTKEIIFVIFGALIAGLIAKFPDIFNIVPDYFYQRNIGFIAFPVLMAYFIWKNNISVKKVVIAFFATLVGVVFINAFPNVQTSDTLILSCIHLPIFLWALLGFIYVGDNNDVFSRRIDFLRYNGDLVIMTGLLFIAGMALSIVTFALFKVIGVTIENFYVKYVAVFGIAAMPIVGTYITQTNPQLVNKVSPVIAKIFSPLVLIMLLIYLGAILFIGKDPYNDREFLMVFNFLLIGVMAIIFFSVAETIRNENRSGNYILLGLSIVTIVVNCIALSAILFRISEWGITPNRLAILGANVLMLSNLLMIAYRLYRNISKKADIHEVEKSISIFLPIYVLWTIVVIFIFPLMFQFK
jgi:hypothetical protein